MRCQKMYSKKCSNINNNPADADAVLSMRFRCLCCCLSVRMGEMKKCLKFGVLLC